MQLYDLCIWNSGHLNVTLYVITRVLSFRKKIGGNINLHTIRNDISAQRKQSFVLIVDERLLGVVNYFLNKHNRDFDILQENLGMIMENQLRSYL